MYLVENQLKHQKILYIFTCEEETVACVTNILSVYWNTKESTYWLFKMVREKNMTKINAKLAVQDLI